MSAFDGGLFDPMAVLHRLAQPFEGHSPVRVALVVVGVVLTIPLAPTAVFGAFFGVTALSSYHQNPGVVSMAMLGLGGLLGLVAAWCRLLISNRVYRRSDRLLYSTVAGLIMGIATATVLFSQMWRAGASEPFPFWVLSCVALLGLALLAATLGTRMGGPEALTEESAAATRNP